LEPIDVGYEVVKHLRPATAIDIKAPLTRMIKKWERSGQGGRYDDDEHWRAGKQDDLANITPEFPQ
jgi:hypothetical protein